MKLHPGSKNMFLFAFRRRPRNQGSWRGPPRQFLIEPFRQRGRRSQIVLQRAGDPHTTIRSADGTQASRVFIGLRQQQSGIFQHATKEKLRGMVARKRSIGKSRVDQRNSGAAATGCLKKIRPQLRLGHHQQRRADPFQHAANGECKVKRTVEESVGGQPFTRGDKSAFRCGRN